MQASNSMLRSDLSESIDNFKVDFGTSGPSMFSKLHSNDASKEKLTTKKNAYKISKKKLQELVSQQQSKQMKKNEKGKYK